jgi:hypothetical protein
VERYAEGAGYVRLRGAFPPKTSMVLICVKTIVLAPSSATLWFKDIESCIAIICDRMAQCQARTPSPVQGFYCSTSELAGVDGFTSPGVWLNRLQFPFPAKSDAYGSQSMRCRPCKTFLASLWALPWP